MSPSPATAPLSGVGSVVGLTIANAMIFQEILADHEPRVERLRKILDEDDIHSRFACEWKMILADINYHPIFNVAHELLLSLPSSPDVTTALRSLAEKALEIVRLRAALRHDLMGRIYHRLLAEAKYLGAFYTSVSAAAILLKLALDSTKWTVPWENLTRLAAFKVGDLACGTGTLLMASAEAITDNYVRACAANGNSPDMGELSRHLMQDIIHGYDVLPSALHLTASTLALRTPEVTFKAMRLWSVPFGGKDHRLGSIEFLTDPSMHITADLFGGKVAPGQVTATGDAEKQAIRPELDLCVMNPPFTRSVGGNLLFGSLPDKQRKIMQKDLAKLLRDAKADANTTAGLGSVFVVVGDRCLKPGGRMALVLPKAILSGVAWEKSRQLINGRYCLEYVVVSSDPDRWNFSENTDLSETLLVARKLNGPENSGNQKVTFINFWKNPGTAVEGVAVAHQIVHGTPPDLATGQGALELKFGDKKIGEVVSSPWVAVRNSAWILPCSFAQTELIRLAINLREGIVKLPGQSTSTRISLCPLKHLGTLGPDRRDIHDGFSLSKSKTTHRALWGHDSSQMKSLIQKDNTYLSALSKAKPGRHLRKAVELWEGAGQLLIGERLWLKTQHLVAAFLKRKALSNVWWPVAFQKDSEAAAKILALWLNSTLGLVHVWSYREETRGAWIDFKKPVLSSMPVLDYRKLTKAQQQRLIDVFDKIGKQTLQPFPKMAEDKVRKEIDRVLCQVLKLSDCSGVRELLAQEPIVCLRSLAE